MQQSPKPGRETLKKLASFFSSAKAENAVRNYVRGSPSPLQAIKELITEHAWLRHEKPKAAEKLLQILAEEARALTPEERAELIAQGISSPDPATRWVAEKAAAPEDLARAAEKALAEHQALKALPPEARQVIMDKAKQEILRNPTMENARKAIQQAETAAINLANLLQATATAQLPEPAKNQILKQALNTTTQNLNQLTQKITELRKTTEKLAKTLNNPELNPQARKAIAEATTDPEEAQLIAQITTQLSKATNQPQEQIAQALTKYITKYPQTHKTILKKLLQQTKQNPHQTHQTIKQTKPPTPPNPKQTIKQTLKKPPNNLGGWVRSVAWSPQGDKLAVGGDFRKVFVFSSSGSKLWESSNLGDYVRSVAWSPQGDKLAVGGDFRKVFVFSSSGSVLWESGYLGGWVRSVAWSPQGDKLAVGGDFRKVFVFSSSGSVLWESSDLGGGVNSVAWSPQGDKLAVGGDFRKVFVFGVGWLGCLGCLGVFDGVCWEGLVGVGGLCGLFGGAVLGSGCGVEGVSGLVAEGLRCVCGGDWGCFAGALEVWGEAPFVDGGELLFWVASLLSPREVGEVLGWFEWFSREFGVPVNLDGFLDEVVGRLLSSNGGGRPLLEVASEFRGWVGGFLKTLKEWREWYGDLDKRVRRAIKEFVFSASGGRALGVDEVLKLLDGCREFVGVRGKGVEGLGPSVGFVGEVRAGEFCRAVLRVCFGVRVPGVVTIVSAEVGGGGEVRLPKEGFRVDVGSGCAEVPLYVLARAGGEVPVEVRLAFEGPGGFGGEFVRTATLRVSGVGGSGVGVGEGSSAGFVGVVGEAAVPAGPGSGGFPEVLRGLFEPLEFLGEGGFGRVWRVRRVSDGSVSAVKVPRLVSAELGRVFLREVSVWLRLKHRNIVELRDANVVPVPYLEMEFVPGARFRGRVVRCLEDLPKPVDPELAVRVFEGVAAGVAYAHSVGVVHRDLKPLNVLLGEGLVPKITDWGLAKLSAVTSSRVGLKAYSPAYAAPEQVDEASFGGTDERTDIYQLGLILYELLTGRLPYEAVTPAALVAKVVREDVPPDPPSRHCPDLKPFDASLMKALAKRKELRYSRVEDFVRDVREALRKYLGAAGESLEEVRREVEEVKRTMKASIRRGAGREEVRALKARYAELLGRYAVAALREGQVEEAIEGLEELLYYTSKHEEELARAIQQIEVLTKNKAPISEDMIKQVRLITAKIAAEARGPKTR